MVRSRTAYRLLAGSRAADEVPEASSSSSYHHDVDCHRNTSERLAAEPSTPTRPRHTSLEHPPPAYEDVDVASSSIPKVVKDDDESWLDLPSVSGIIAAKLTVRYPSRSLSRRHTLAIPHNTLYTALIDVACLNPSLDIVYGILRTLTHLQSHKTTT